MRLLQHHRRQTKILPNIGRLFISSFPYHAVKRYLQFDNNQLICKLDPKLKRTKHWQNIYLAAFGKAAPAMIKAAQEIMPAERLAGKPIAVTNYQNVQEIDGITLIGAGHPLPDQAGIGTCTK